MAKRRNRYHNLKCEYNGLKFDSKTEMEYYKYLLGLQEIGDINISNIKMGSSSITKVYIGDTLIWEV